MNVLIIGLGSIGQRHLKNLQSIRLVKKIYIYRKKFQTPTLINYSTPSKKKIDEIYDVTYIKNLKNLSKYNIHVAFICSPTSLHTSQAIELIKNKINVFVEKPINNNLKNINKLYRLISKNRNVKHMIGYQLKFNPLIKKLKSIINRKNIGKIYHVQIHHGEHINDFHPYEDYKISYAARKKLGGGVVLTQSHEIDYLMYLFDNYNFKKKYSLNTKQSNLKLDVEDNSLSIVEMSKKKQSITCSIYLNYFERPRSRSIKIIGEKISISANFINNTIEINKKKKKKILRFFFDKNLIFKKEIYYFLKAVQNNNKIDKKLDLFWGIKVLKNCLNILKN